MIFILLKKKWLIGFMVGLLVLVVLVSVIASFTLFNEKSQYLKQESVNAFYVSGEILLAQNKVVEIFDVSGEKVIKRVLLSQAIEKEAKNLLYGITGIYVKVKPFPTNGKIIRIPLESNVKMKNQWLDQEVNEVFVLIPAHETPFFMVLDPQQRPLFFNFKGNLKNLLSELDLEV